MSLIGCEIAKIEITHFQRHCLLLNMQFTKEDKILIKNVFDLKGYNARHLVREFSRKKLKCQQRLQVVAIAMVTGWSTVVPAVQITRRLH